MPRKRRSSTEAVPSLHAGNGRPAIRLLQALNRLRLEHGLPGLIKPCFAVVVDSNGARAADRHHADSPHTWSVEHTPA
jgi:hypothetical protein